MKIQEINTLKEEFNKLTAMITNAKSVTEDLEKKADKIKKQLEDAEKKATDGKLREWWKPVGGEKYYTIYSEGLITAYNWRNDNVDNRIYSFGMSLKTKEEAEFEAERRKVYFELKRYVYEHDPRPITKEDWKNYSMTKHLMFYDHRNDEIIFDIVCVSKHMFDIYASNEQTLKDAVKAIGKDRIKKYLFEVE